MKETNSKIADLFKPQSFLLFYLLFIVIAALSFSTTLPLKKPSLLSFVIIFITFPFYLLGIKLGKHVYGKKIPAFINFLYIGLLTIFYGLVLTNFYKFNFYLSLALCAVAFSFIYLVILKKLDIITSATKGPSFLFIVGAVFLFMAFFQEKGIPLLNPALKVNLLHNTFFGISMLIFIFGFTLLMPQIKEDKKFFLILIIGTTLFLLSAFRGSILAIFLTGIFIAYYAKKVDNKKVFLALVVAFLLIISIGYLARPLFDPLNLFLFRAGSTHVVFDDIVQKSMPFGYTHGTLFFQGNPRDFVGQEIVGKQANITYTILGAAVMDFGIIGAVLWMFSLGMILQIAYTNMRIKGFEGFYPLLFSLSLIFIEIGADPFFLFFFFIFLIFYFVKNTKNRYKQMIYKS
ncbi:TPA: hypothetical protein H1005_04210 [archaeon]|uniref:O-antigen ligase domain-containing protein n=1 Tax=Candidatus Naiadarchaeum limnaeum TaxID=2756139 RepID=A0A832UR65_9ARCH|nr:hypothetical protein [Candidatus Naiadarchaeales archaeon SRR2090153.bin1042]HIK00152.1 hypothetical protein [Candidatus Naiadarchaeum limnaeum]